MNQPPAIPSVLRVPNLSRKRMVVALLLALAADALQISLGPLGWLVIDQGIDIVAMLLISAAVGFHPLFLPTFVAEFIPGIDMLPTWTGCVLVVLAWRWKAQPRFNKPSAPTPPPPRSDVIDV